MSNVFRPKSVFVAASAMLLAGAVAFAGVQTDKQLARVKKDRNGNVSFKQVAGYTGYETDNEYHAKIKELTDPQAIYELKMKHHQLNIEHELNGGVLHGSIERGGSLITIDIVGTGTAAGFHHSLTFPAKFEVHSEPHDPSVEIDTFRTNMYRIEGAAGGDSLFSSLRLVGGTANGFASPGQMTLIDKGDSVLVDSFFNIGYRIEFTGADGGPLAGVQDSFEGTVTMRAHGTEQAVTGGK
ncbi:MAG TPA: hypothetical protein VEL74_20515 [Thermoanaerobaculia bacterium]|nr:hypothetical protein [Thermoanaerobaculia bacterium]